MISKILINVDSINHINDYRKVGVSAFLFALKDYAVGYNTFCLEEIKKVDVSNKYILLNRVLDCNDINNLYELLDGLVGIKGIIYEDIGVYQVVKKLGLEVELICFQNHFGTNSSFINFWLDRVDSAFVCNELTLSEIAGIVNKASKPVCVHLYGHNQVMYSRRLLLSNWSEEFNIPYKNTNIIEDKATHIRFMASESLYGTVMYSDKIFNGSELLNLENVKFFYVNPMFIEHEQVMSFLTESNKKIRNNEDDGFLHKKTIYKLKERDK